MKHKKKIKKYFGENEESAIRLYLRSTNPIERQILFETYIYQAFDKLAENIINTYRFYNTGHDFKTLKGDVTSFLVQKLDYFSPEKNKKAFSYFGTVAKHYLIQETRRKNRLTYYNEIDNDNEIASKPNQIPIQEESEIITIFKDAIIHKLPVAEVKDKQYAIFLQSLILILQTHKSLEYMNKKYIKLYMKESSGLSNEEISKYLNKAKAEFLSKIYKKYINDKL